MSLKWENLKLNDIVGNEHHVFEIKRIAEKYITLKVFKVKSGALKIEDIICLTKQDIDFLQLNKVYFNNYKKDKYELSFRKRTN